ncbi:MAG: hypothetical protein KBG19_07805 [Bacteroidales bacterium]|jgi:hypothetical protein|nr:hypothetical protein [Bacteroidales bacterium]
MKKFEIDISCCNECPCYFESPSGYKECGELRQEITDICPACEIFPACPLNDAIEYDCGIDYEDENIDDEEKDDCNGN